MVFAASDLHAREQNLGLVELRPSKGRVQFSQVCVSIGSILPAGCDITRKPIALMSWLVRLACRPGGVVLDPFMGSGTTGVAAVSQGMRFVGIEMDAEHVHLSRRRITHAAGCGESDPQVLLGSATEPLAVLGDDDDSQMALFG